MKKTVISAALLVSGILTTLGVVVAAAISLPQITAWSNEYPSRLWFAILAGNSQFGDGANGLGLGLFFFTGIALFLFGLIGLLREYFKKEP